MNVVRMILTVSLLAIANMFFYYIGRLDGLDRAMENSASYKRATEKYIRHLREIIEKLRNK